MGSAAAARHRLRSAGYEITAAGYANAAAALDGWKVSPPHRAILDNSGTWADDTFAAIGVGLETAPGAGPYAGPHLSRLVRRGRRRRRARR